MNYLVKGAAVAVFAMMGSTAMAASLNGVGTYEGVAGVGSSNGDVGDSPTGSSYIYVTTAGSSYTGAGLGIGSETNGSVLTTNSFVGNAGETLSYNFNYVTSDGTASYVEYAYAQLTNLDTSAVSLIFTARTNPDNTQPASPGFGLPALDAAVTLNPATALINQGATTWSELGSNSGSCYNTAGCGSTGWVNSSLNLTETANYALTFGVVNWKDTAYNSGLAISGITVGDQVIIDPNNPSAVPLPASGLLLIGGLAGMVAARRRKAA